MTAGVIFEYMVAIGSGLACVGIGMLVLGLCVMFMYGIWKELQ